MTKQLDEIASMLGMPKESWTVKNLYHGRIDKEEAIAIAESCIKRHRHTNYGSLLNHGFSKKEARKKMEKL